MRDDVALKKKNLSDEAQNHVTKILLEKEERTSTRSKISRACSYVFCGLWRSAKMIPPLVQKDFNRVVISPVRIKRGGRTVVFDFNKTRKTPLSSREKYYSHLEKISAETGDKGLFEQLSLLPTQMLREKTSQLFLQY